jgi:hypothetical protein
MTSYLNKVQSKISDEAILRHSSRCCKENRRPRLPPVIGIARETFFFSLKSSALSGNKKPSRHSLSSIPNFPQSPGPHCSIFESMLVFHRLSCFDSVWWTHRFSFVSFGRGSSWSTTTGLIGDVCVTIFTILYPTSDSTSIHAGIHLLNPCVNTRSLQQDILSLHVAETTGPHQPFSRLEIATAKYVDRRRKFHSDVRRQVNYK